MTQRLIDVYTKVPKLVSHLHLPVQAGFRPRAGGDEARLHDARIQVHRPQAARARPDISRCPPDFIVGFPGETDEDFERP